MFVTKKLRQLAQDRLGAAPDASDEDIKAAVKAALEEDKLPATEVAATQDDGDAKAELSQVVGDAVDKKLSPIMEQLGRIAESLAKQPKPAEKKPEPKPDDAAIDERIDRSVEAAVEKLMAQQEGPSLATRTMVRGAMTPRVKSVAEQYAHTKSVLTYPAHTKEGRPHPFAGRVARIGTRALDTTSELEHAANGAVIKWYLSPSRLTEHERHLCDYALNEMRWTGNFGPDGEGEAVQGQKLTQPQRKALIDDATSGGTYMVPTPFDDDIVQTPLLFGELFPLVNVVPLARGASVDGFAMGHVTITSDHTEGEAISLETTSGLVTNLDTSIFPCVGAIEIGLDWESDTPVNVGQAIAADYGEQLKVWLDEQIAIGDGSTEPEGIFTKSGVGTVTHGSTSSAFTIGDFEQLMFGLGKAMRASKGGRCVYVTTDTMYRRARSTPVGSSDARRVLGMDHEAYEIMERPCKIQNSITDGSIGYCNLGWYKMFQRLGIQLRVVTEGQTLALKNTRLVVLRARYGGQLQLASAMCSMTDGPQTG